MCERHTLEMSSGWPCSSPPCSVKPHGAPPWSRTSSSCHRAPCSMLHGGLTHTHCFTHIEALWPSRGTGRARRLRVTSQIHWGLPPGSGSSNKSATRAQHTKNGHKPGSCRVEPTFRKVSEAVKVNRSEVLSYCQCASVCFTVLVRAASLRAKPIVYVLVR